MFLLYPYCRYLIRANLWLKLISVVKRRSDWAQSNVVSHIPQPASWHPPASYSFHQPIQECSNKNIQTGLIYTFIINLYTYLFVTVKMISNIYYILQVLKIRLSLRLPARCQPTEMMFFLQELTRIDNRIHTKHSVYDGVYHWTAGTCSIVYWLILAVWPCMFIDAVGSLRLEGFE